MSQSSLIRTLSLKTYGDALTGGSVGSWIGIARAIMYLMAVVECAIWTYATSFMSSDPFFRWVIGIGVGLSILILVLLIDVTLLSAPVRRPAALIEPESPVASNRIMSDEDSQSHAKLSLSWKFSLSVLIRIALASISIIIMSPFLNLAVFEKDITAQLEQERITALDTKEKALTQVFLDLKKRDNVQVDRLASEIAALQEQSRTLTEKYAAEIDGKGGSKKVGVGKIARALREEISANDQKVVLLKEEFQRELSKLNPDVKKADEALSDFNQAKAKRLDSVLRDRFGITIGPDSLSDRLRVFYQSISTSPSAKTVQWIVMGFQLFLIAALLLMKIFEPDDVAFYFNSEVQNSYVKFKSGMFDEVARDGTRRSDIRFPLSPSLFWEIVVSLKRALAENDEFAHKRFTQERELKGKSLMLESQSELLSLSERFIEDRQKNVDENEERLRSVNLALEDLRFELKQLTSQINFTEAQLSDPRENLRKSEIDSKMDLLEELQLRTNAGLAKQEQLERMFAQANDSVLRSKSLHQRTIRLVDDSGVKE
jgi:Domain of unknown function (DUF4407)